MTSKTDPLIEKIKCIAKEIYTELGGGYLENVYEEAMAIELRAKKIQYEVERNREIFYKGIRVGTHRLDFIIESDLVVEIKATNTITRIHMGQTQAYLRVTGIKKGLIINFPYPEKEEGPDFQEVPEK